MTTQTHRLHGWLLALLLWLSPALVQAAQYKDCLRLYRTRQLSQAAHCFEAVARSLKGSLTPKQRIRKGRALRNAANLLERTAKRSQRVEIAAYQRARATAMLKQYLDEKLYEAPYQKKSVELSMLRLRRAVGYASLTVVPGNPKARLLVKGYQFRAQTTGTWSQTVRPGPYQLRVTYPSGATLTRKIVVSPDKNKVVPLTPPALRQRRRPPPRVVTRRPPPRVVTRRPPPHLLRRQPPPPTPRVRSRAPTWATLGVGAAVLLGGGAVLVAAAITDAQKTALHQQEFNKAPGQRLDTASADVVGLHQTATTLFPVGWVLLGVGAATTATGGALFLIK